MSVAPQASSIDSRDACRCCVQSLVDYWTLLILRPEGSRHALVPELTLRPLLTEIGGTVPTRALYVLDREHDQTEAYADWLALARPVVGALLDT